MLKKLLSVILILKKQLMITILILGILVIPGCKKGENGIDTLYRPNKPGDPTQEMLDRSKEEAMNVYKELLANEESDLIELMDWLYEKEGYYYLGDQSQGPYLHTNKGEDYGFDSENTKRLFKILKKYCTNIFLIFCTVCLFDCMNIRIAPSHLEFTPKNRYNIRQ